MPPFPARIGVSQCPDACTRKGYRFMASKRRQVIGARNDKPRCIFLEHSQFSFSYEPVFGLEPHLFGDPREIYRSSVIIDLDVI